jgi:hypothetical protein
VTAETYTRLFGVNVCPFAHSHRTIEALSQSELNHSFDGQVAERWFQLDASCCSISLTAATALIEKEQRARRFRF